MTGGPNRTTDRRERLEWRQVGILYGREMRAALREKTIVINSILIPIFLYPFLLWAAFSAMIFVQGQTEGFASRIRVGEWPKGHPALRRSFERDDRLQLTGHPARPRAGLVTLASRVAVAFGHCVPAGEATDSPGRTRPVMLCGRGRWTRGGLLDHRAESDALSRPASEAAIEPRFRTTKLRCIIWALWEWRLIPFLGNRAVR